MSEKERCNKLSFLHINSYKGGVINSMVKKVLVNTLILLLLTTTLIPSLALASTATISNLHVKLEGENAGGIGAYYIGFSNGTTPISSDNDDAITIQFPAGTLLSKTSLGTGDVKVNNVALLGNSILVDGSNRTITIHKQLNIPENTFTQIEVTAGAGVVNPVTIGNRYSLNLQVVLGDDVPTSITSNLYRIVGSPITIPTFSMSNTGAGKQSDYTIQFNGSLVEKDMISILFPKTFAIQRTASLTNFIQINGKAVSKADLKPHLAGTDYEMALLEITVPNGVSTFTNKEVIVTIKANHILLNPSVEGDYPVTVHTSREVIPRTSKAIEVRNQASNIKVQLSPNQYREAGEYTITFKTTGALEGANNDYIDLLFPTDTVIPSSVANGNVLINTYISKKVERITYKDGSTTYSGLRVYLPDNRFVGAGKDVTLNISSRANLLNPATNNHVIQLRTSTDRSYANSAIYSTYGGNSTTPGYPGSAPGQGTNSGLKLSSSDVGAVSRYEIGFRTGSGGALTGGADSITITFNKEVQLPEFIDRDTIRINNVPLDTGMVSISEQTITFRLSSKLNVAGNQSFTIVIDEKANIIHPYKEGWYDLYVKTSRDSSVRYRYDIKGRASYAFYITPEYDANDQITSYNMIFRTNKYTTLTGGIDWVDLTLPRAITRDQLMDNIGIDFNGVSIDIDRVQVSGQKLSFFIPHEIDIARDTEAYIVVHDPNRILSFTKDSTITFKIKTSKDTSDATSNPIKVFKQTNVPPSKPTTPTNPNTQQPGTGTQTPQTGTNLPANVEIKLFLDKKETYINNVRSDDLIAAPYLHPKVDGVTMVPIRFIAEALGAKVEYEPVGRKIPITFNNQYIVLTVDSDVVIKQGGGERMPASVELKAEGITFIPVRFLTEWMGFKVDFDIKERSIILQK